MKITKNDLKRIILETLNEAEVEDGPTANPALQKSRIQIQAIIKLMFKPPQVAKRLERIKANDVLKAQFFAVMAEMMGVEPDQLNTLVAKVRTQQKALGSGTGYAAAAQAMRAQGHNMEEQRRPKKIRKRK